jgi:tetratricopeptide (TPR) repeat protein
MSEGERKYRERLLRQVRKTKPGILVGEVLTYSRFRKPYLVEEYLARCDRLISTRPAEALQLAKVAPKYAKLTALEVGKPEDKRLEARAWAVLGSAHRGMGEYRAADEAFKSAAEIRGDRDEYYSLVCRVAVMRTEQRRYNEAIELADRSIAYFEKRYDPTRKINERDNYSLASALAIRGFTRFQAYNQGEDLNISLAAIDYKRALEVCTRWTPRTRLNSLQSLISLICLGWLGGNQHIRVPAVDIDRSFETLRQCIKKADGRVSVAYAKALWVQASARARIAGSMMVPRSECLFLEASELLRGLEQWEDFVHVTVEIAWWYIQSGEWIKAKGVLTPLLSSDWSGKYPSHWFAVIEAWVKTETLEAATKTIETVRDCKITLPKMEVPGDHDEGRWVSDDLW